MSNLFDNLGNNILNGLSGISQGIGSPYPWQTQLASPSYPPGVVLAPYPMSDNDIKKNLEELLEFNQKIIDSFQPRTKALLDVVRSFLTKNAVFDTKSSEVAVGRYIEDLVKELSFEQKIAEALNL